MRSVTWDRADSSVNGSNDVTVWLRLQCFPADLNLGDSQRVSHGRVCSH
jgi:hypothetical protein